MDNVPTLEELEAVFGQKEAPRDSSIQKDQPTYEELHAAFGAPKERSEDEDLSAVVGPLSSFGAGMAKGLVGLADIPAAAQRGLLKLAEKGYLPKPERPVMIPTVEEMVDIPALKEEPTSVAGKYAQTVGEFVPMGGVKAALAPGLLSETAGQVTKGTPYEPYARVAGAVTGAGVAGLPGYLTGPRAARSMVTGATEGVTPAQVDLAENLFTQAKELGVPITRAEALQQVTQGATSLADIQRVIEGEGGLRQFFAPRPQQIQEAARRQFGKISPELEKPELVGPRAGEAARKEVAEAHAARTERARPYYKQAAEQTVSPTAVSDAITKIDELIASDPTKATHRPLRELRDRLVAVPATKGVPSSRTPVVDPKTGSVIRYESSPAIPPTPEKYVTDIESLDRIRKEFRDRTSLPFEEEKAIDKEIGAKINNLMDDLNKMAEERSVQFRLGKKAYQEATRDIVEPIEAGPTGKIAEEGISTEKVTGALFPSSPLPGSEESLARTIKALEGKEPNVARDLVRAHLERTFNEATQALQSGLSQFGGAKFAAVVAGNPQQRKNLLTAVSSLPGGEKILPGVEQFLDVLQATGTRQPIGSRTAFNTELLGALKVGIPIEKAVIPVALKNWVQKIAAGKNTEELSRLLTDPAAAKDFKTLATGNNYAKLKAMSDLVAKASSYGVEAGARTGQFEERQGRATGGAVKITPTKLLAMAERAKKKIQTHTKSILEQPDEHVVHALKVANGSINDGQ